MIAIKTRFDGRQIEVPPQMRDAEPGEVLIVYDDKQPAGSISPPSIWNAFGKAANPRTKDDIDQQIREERESWGDR